MSGFSKSAVALVAAACFIAASMTATGLDRRIALIVLSKVVHNLGLRQASAFAILMLLSLFLIVIHLGFGSATALASTMIPIIISVLAAVQTPGINRT